MAYSQPPILADVLAVKPPSSPVSQSDYWSATFTAAWRKVRDLCRRKLVTASYTDYIRTFPQAVGDVGDLLHVAYLREPITHGGTLTVSAITLGGTTVDAADYQAYHDRIVLESPGEVVVAYTGGYATTDAEWVVVLLAVHDVGFARETAAALEALLATSRRVDPTDPAWQRGLAWRSWLGDNWPALVGYGPIAPFYLSPAGV